MAIFKNNTGKAIGKTWKKAINEYGPTVAEHSITALAAATLTYLGTATNKTRKLKKVAKMIPGGKRIVESVSSNIPFLKSERQKSNGHNQNNTHRTRKRAKRSKKQQAA